MSFSGMPDYTMPLYRPPSEARSLIFQITDGCSWNRCTFCAMYDEKPFRIKPVEAVLQEIRAVPDAVAASVLKVFLADGDAAIYPIEGLVAICDALNERFPKLRRISAYVGPQALAAKDETDWARLVERKFTLMYFGLESGDDTILGWMKKGTTAGDAAMGVARAQSVGMKFSVMVILGAGGRQRMKEHALSSAAWVSTINPNFLSLLTLFVRKGKEEYLEHITLPTVGGLLDESALFVQNVEGTNIIFRSNHVSNMVQLEGILSRDRDRVLAQIDRARKLAESRGMLNELPELYREGI